MVFMRKKPSKKKIRFYREFLFGIPVLVENCNKSEHIDLYVINYIIENKFFVLCRENLFALGKHFY